MRLIRKIEEAIVWWLMIRMCHRWASRHMDQFESVKFQTSYGTVYFSLSLQSPYPDHFEPVTKNGRHLPRQ